jgi:hypothetical protein
MAPMLLSACGTGIIITFLADPTSGTVPLTVTFTWSTDGATRCGISFGDGVANDVACGEGTQTHTYVAEGVYSAQFLALDESASDLTGPYLDRSDISIAVSGIGNNAPVVTGESVTTPQGQAVTVDVLQNDSDPDGDAISLISFAYDPTGVGIIVTNNLDGSLTVDPGPSFTGTITVDYTVADERGGSADGVLLVTVVPVSQGGLVGVDIFDLSGNRQNPLAAAIQVGNGNWTPVTPLSLGRIEYDVPAGESRVGVMIRCSMDLVRSLHFTLTEADNVRVECDNNSDPKVNIGVAWTGVDALFMGAASYSVTVHGASGTIGSGSGANGGTTIPNQPAVLSDLLVAGRADGIVVGVRLMRDVTLQNGMTYSFPFEAADRGAAATVDPFTVPGGYSGGFVALLASPRAIVDLGFGTNAGGVYYTAPSSLSGVQYLGGGFATVAGSQIAHFQARAEAMTLSFNLPDPWDSFTPPTLRTFNGLDSSDPDLANYNFSLVRTSPSPSIGWGGIVTPGWLGASTSYTVPDPSGLSGFEDFVFNTGDMVNYAVERVRSSLPLNETLDARRVLNVPMVGGLDWWIVSRNGVIQF